MIYRCSEITGKGIRFLGKNIEKLISLETLKLHFSECYKVHDFGFFALSKALKKLQSLKAIDLDFSK